MKISVSSYSFYQKLKSGNFTQLDCMKEAKRMGFDAIELVGIIPSNSMSLIQCAEAIAEESYKLSLPISCYTIGADFLNCDDIDDEISRVISELDLAVTLGAPLMRHDVSVGKNSDYSDEAFERSIEKFVYGCRQVADYASVFGITTMIENHGFFVQDSARVKRLCLEVNRSNFRLLCDVGNFLCADEDIISAVKNVAPLTEYIHVKDFNFLPSDSSAEKSAYFNTRGGNYLAGAVLGQGVVPIKEVISLFRKAGYAGYLSLEYEGQTDCISAIEAGKCFLDNLI